MLRFQLAQLGAVAVRVVVPVWIVGFLEFGDRGLDGEEAVFVQEERTAGEAGLLEVVLEFGSEVADLGLWGMLKRGCS